MLPALWATSDSYWLVPLIVTQFVNAFFSMLAALCFMVIATSSVDADAQGMATGMATQSQQVGIAIGIPLISAVFAAVIGQGTVTAAEELTGIHTAIGVAGFSQVAVGLLLWLVLRRKVAQK